MRSRSRCSRHGAAWPGGVLVESFPELQEIFHVLGQFQGLGGLAGGADDQAHLRRQPQFLGQFFEAMALFFFFDLAGNPQVGLLGQEHQTASGQRDIGAEVGALGGGLLFVDLDDELLAFAQHPLNLGLGPILGFFLVIVGMHFRQGQETVALPAVVDKGGLEAGLDIDHDAFVNIGLGGFPGGGLQGQLFNMAFFDDGDPKNLRVGGVDKHLTWWAHDYP